MKDVSLNQIEGSSFNNRNEFAEIVGEKTRFILSIEVNEDKSSIKGRISIGKRLLEDVDKLFYLLCPTQSTVSKFGNLLWVWLMLRNAFPC